MSPSEVEGVPFNCCRSFRHPFRRFSFFRRFLPSSSRFPPFWERKKTSPVCLYDFFSALFFFIFIFFIFRPSTTFSAHMLLVLFLFFLFFLLFQRCLFQLF